MKKILALLPLIAVLGLAGCEGGKETDEGGGDHLEYSEEQAKAKVKQLGESDGYEITYEVKSSDNESSHYTLGAKSHFYWAGVEEARYLYYVDDVSYQPYYYDSDALEFKKYGEPQLLEDMAEDDRHDITSTRDGFAMFLYSGNSFATGDGLTKKGQVTFAGRNATKYEYKWAAVQGSASYELIIDNETGITLKIALSAQYNVTGESGFASVEVTSFKTGSVVEIPAHEK